MRANLTLLNFAQILRADYAIISASKQAHFN
jgi:hypothetical protein